jgi:GAF domain-containing protein
LPVPVRGLREAAYRTGRTVYENDFSHSEWLKFMPEGHTNLDNVLFAPLIIQGNAAGILGLGNKQGGFTENDAKLATAFGELASIALQNSRLMDALKKAKDKLEIRVRLTS